MGTNDKIQDKWNSAIRAYRWYAIKQHKVLWVLFALSILFSIACPILINFYFPADLSPQINALISGLANISYGYLSGFLVYLFGTFLPSTKEDVELKDKIYFQLYLIFDNFLSSEEKFLSNAISEISSKEYQVIIYNYLVSGYEITNDILEMDAQPDFPLVNEEHYSSLVFDLTNTREFIADFLEAYKKELDSQDLEVINKIYQLKDSLEKSIEQSLPTNGNSPRRYKSWCLIRFVADYEYYWRFSFLQLCKKYGQFKYCEYDIKYNGSIVTHD